MLETAAQGDADSRWYTNGWVWLLIAIPGCTVIGCLLTIWLAISNPDTLVRDPVPDGAAVTRTPQDALP